MAENKGSGNKGARQDSELDDLNADQGINQGQKSGRHPQGSQQSGQQGNLQSGRHPEGSEQTGSQQRSGRRPQGSERSGQEGNQQSLRQGNQQSGGRNAPDEVGSPQNWSPDNSIDKQRGNR